MDTPAPRVSFSISPGKAPRLEFTHGHDGYHQQDEEHQQENGFITTGTEEPNEDPVEEASSSSPPDGGTVAWTQVFASFLINMNVYGLVNAFGDFQHFYETKYLTSYTSSEISWIGTVQASFTLFIGALAGPLFDRGYFMLTLKVAGTILVFSWMMLSLASQYYQVRTLKDEKYPQNAVIMLISSRSCSHKVSSPVFVSVSWKCPASPSSQTTSGDD